MSIVISFPPEVDQPPADVFRIGLIKKISKHRNYFNLHKKHNSQS